MIDEGNRASVVIDELRAMFRKDNSRQALVDVNRLILNTLSLTSHEIRVHNISVQTTLFESSTLLVMADQVQLQQVILNLIVNAVEAMKSTSGARRGWRIASGLHDADGVLITVRGFWGWDCSGKPRQSFQYVFHDQADRDGNGTIDMPFDYRSSRGTPVGFGRSATRMYFSRSSAEKLTLRRPRI